MCGRLISGLPPSSFCQALYSKLVAIEGVKDVHDLHVWALAPDALIATVHIRGEGDTNGTITHAQQVFAQ